jgi:sulfur carrier protein ThiS
MPRLKLTSHLARTAGGTEFQLTGETVRELLESCFALQPQLRGYLLDDQGTLRHHVAAFINGQPITDKDSLTQPVPSDGELFLMQALSGG